MSTEAPARQLRLHAKKSRTLKDKDWEPFKRLIIDIHITRDETLEHVRQHMKDRHGFDATLRQYRSRITKWNLDKNVKVVERQFIVQKQAERRMLEPNKKGLVFKVRGKLISKAKIERWTREEVKDNTLYTGAYETDSDSESSAPNPDSPLFAQAVETTLAISGPMDPDGVFEDSNVESEMTESIGRRDHTADMPFWGTHMTDQESTLNNMDTELADSAFEDWWDKLCAVPTLLVGNAAFLQDSPPPILPQCSDDLFLPILPPSDLQDRDRANTLRHGAEAQHQPDVHAGSSLMNQDSDAGFALTENKSRELLNLIESDVFKFTRDKEQGPFTEQAQRLFLVGDRQDPDHPLSRAMMQTYLLSYWENFSDQIPILHRPTFNPDTAPVILLVAMMAIGAAMFSTKCSGSTATPAAAGMCLPNYLAWGVKWEMFRDRNFRAPASLWALQASILLETYEALYSTGDLHERAVMYHPSTIQLVRWGRSLIGAADDSKLWTSAPSSAPETGDAVDGWWHRWITTEATRRLAFASFVVDSMHSTIFGNSSIMTFHEVRIQLPCDDKLWKATNGAEVRRSMARSMTAGAKRITFLEALKRTVAGELVQTSNFGRTILLAGLLNVSFHGNRGDLQDRGIGNIAGTGVGGKSRPDMAKAIDSWKRNSEHARLPGLESQQVAHQAGRYVDSNIAFLHQFAHMAIHTDFLECQIFAGAKQFMGKKVDAASRLETEQTMRSWAQSAKGRDAAFHALCLLRSVLVPEASGVKSHDLESRLMYSVKTDTLIYRPWVVYLSALALWSYAFALEGPSLVPPAYSKQGRAEAVIGYLSRYGELSSPVALATVKGLNYNTPILEVLREAFKSTSWEFLRESSALLLGNCIKLNCRGALCS
ncbi:hypothetical protein OQA88_2498 [Cercophora sp. LCS_1]